MKFVGNFNFLMLTKIHVSNFGVKFQVKFQRVTSTNEVRTVTPTRRKNPKIRVGCFDRIMKAASYCSTSQPLRLTSKQI